MPTKSNLIYFATGCIIMLVVAYLFMPQPEPPKAAVEQKQAQTQDCKAVFKRKVNPDGSVDEITEFLSNNSQKQEQSITPVKAKSVALLIGGSTSLKATVDLQLGKHSHQVLTDGVKDHVYIYKFKVLEF
jgi:hypothetical protein